MLLLEEGEETIGLVFIMGYHLQLASSSSLFYVALSLLVEDAASSNQIFVWCHKLDRFLTLEI